MLIYDSHCHYDDEWFDEDREKIIKEINDFGVKRIVNAGYDLKSSLFALDLSKKYDFVYCTMGISPNDLESTWEDTKKEIDNYVSVLEKEIISNKKIVAIGEIGLDYHYETNNKEIQKEAFKYQIEIANRFNLPIVIHTREAIMDTIEMLKDNPVKNTGIFHCCPHNRELVKEALKLGYYISFCGPVTFKNAKNANEIIEMVPDDRFVTETDSPYLSPEPKRGTRNDSRNIEYIIKKIAETKGKSVEEIEKLAWDNANRIYRLNE